jgi:hypothetical protein
LAFDPGRAANLDATCQVCVDRRTFLFAVRDCHLAQA